MADNQIEELSSDGTVGGGGGNPWIPLIAVIVIMPLVSVPITNFVLIPKIKAAVGASGYAEKAEDGGHGGNEHADAHAEGQMIQYAFDPIVANLSGSMKSRYIKVSFTVEGNDADFTAVMEANKAKIKDVTLGVLNALSMRDLEQPGINNIVRNDLLSAFNTLMKRKVIHQVYFTEFVIQ